MKKLLLLLLMVPAMAWADSGKTVQFPVQCFYYKDFIKQIELFEETPVMIGFNKDDDGHSMAVSLLYNQEEDSFSIVQFNRNVGCFLTVGTGVKFNFKGLKIDNLKK